MAQGDRPTEEKKGYRSSLNLPQTTFSIRAEASVREPEILKRWEEGSLYEKASSLNEKMPRFVLHDGPPYSNGHLHMGHALNKVLKDIVAKQKRMSGYHVDFQPGWDCHGLPIELRVASEGNFDTSKGSEEVVELRKACRSYAEKWIEIQKDEFKKLGVVADWDNRYATLDSSYEADILRSLAGFIRGGYIARKGKTVPWCSSCQTVLAAAEIEHKDRKDPSIYLRFDIAPESELPEELQGRKPALLVWTTTPWTIPLNQLVAVHPDASYAVIASPDGYSYLVGKELSASIVEMLGAEDHQVVGEIHSTKLAGLKVSHPLLEERVTPVVASELVSLKDGTACLHIAPGCGPEDYYVGVSLGLDVYSPISPDGSYTQDIILPELSGMKVSDGQWAVLKMLSEKGKLVHKKNITHSYPHCWRCRNGLIFRATDQWFCDLSKNKLLDKTLAAADKITFVPDWGLNRFKALVGSRTEWCISRQRYWGVPITALLCNDCPWSYVNEGFVTKVADLVEAGGIEAWDIITIDELTEKGILAKNFSCGGCSGTSFRKETDTLDVWFDSGCSSHAVLKKRNIYPADLYLEGSDQHRGWFQSSLLCSIALSGSSCARTILTHGYVVDGERRKMSKSLGNGVAPQEVAAKLGTDVLRLWVALSDCEGDVVISDTVLKSTAEAYRKIRNTLRFLLGNLSDFNVTTDQLPYEKLRVLDRYMLSRLFELNRDVRKAYDSYKFTQVSHLISNFCINDLSAFYLDIVKDCLYVESAGGRERRSIQTVLHAILDILVHLLAPILSFTAEEAYQAYTSKEGSSIHLRAFPRLPEQWLISLDSEREGWKLLHEMRKEVMRAIERKREVGEIKLGLEAHIHLALSSEKKDIVSRVLKEKETLATFLEEWFIVSQVSLDLRLSGSEQSWMEVQVEHASGVKCPRCWRWRESEHEDGLCDRCQRVVGDN